MMQLTGNLKLRFIPDICRKNATFEAKTQLAGNLTT
jgi:hypothetical protein